jgi:hypothetical protein
MKQITLSLDLQRDEQKLSDIDKNAVKMIWYEMKELSSTDAPLLQSMNVEQLEAGDSNRYAWFQTWFSEHETPTNFWSL